MSKPVVELAQILRQLDVSVRPGEYVYAVVDRGADLEGAAAMVSEEEGVTVVLPRPMADDRGIAYEFVAAWLTLTVHSALTAVGLTAAVASELARQGISCNVLAGAYHDHILVPVAERDRAVAALRSLARAD